MATNMAPHNLGEVIAAARHLIAHPDATPRRPHAVRPRPGPAHRRQDRRARRRPRGLRDRPRRRSGSGPPPGSSSVTAAPSAASSSPSCRTTSARRRSSRRSRELVKAKKLQGIADVTDLTDGEHGPAAGHRDQERLRPRGRARAAVPADPDGGLLRDQQRRPGRRPAAHAGPARAAARSTSTTGSRSSGGARRSAVGEAEDRLHLVEGLLVAILDIDEVIALIRSSPTTPRRPGSG